MTKKIKYYIISFVFVFQLISLAQNQEIESLLKKLKTSKNDSDKVTMLDGIARVYTESGNFYKAKQYAEQAFELSKKLQYRKGIGSSANILGITNQRTGDFDQSIFFFLEALKIAEKLNIKQFVLATYGNIGSLYSDMKNSNKALEYYFKAYNYAI